MGRNLFLSVQWELKVREHSKQKDGSSCGVFCLMVRIHRHIMTFVHDNMQHLAVVEVETKNIVQTFNNYS